MGATAAELYRAAGSTAWGDRVRQIKAGMRNSMTYVNDTYTWPYWPVLSNAYAGYTATGYTAQDFSSFTQAYSGARQPDDLSHAALSVEFATAAWRTGLATFTLVDLQRLSRTYTKNVAVGTAGAHLKVNGTGTAPASFVVQLPRWIPMAEWNHGVYTHALAAFTAQAPQPTSGSLVAGFAYCVWGALRGYG